MNVKELRRAITFSLEYAQQHSKAPEPNADLFRARYNSIESDRDRLRTFIASLAGSVRLGDPQLSAALHAFLDAKPGQPDHQGEIEK